MPMLPTSFISWKLHVVRFLYNLPFVVADDVLPEIDFGDFHWGRSLPRLLNNVAFTWRDENFFFSNFWRTWVLFVGPLIPLFWTSGNVSSGFQSQSGLPTCKALVGLETGSYHSTVYEFKNPSKCCWLAPSMSIQCWNSNYDISEKCFDIDIWSFII